MTTYRKKLLALTFTLVAGTPQLMADVVQGSTTLPGSSEGAIPEYLYLMKNGNNIACGNTTAPTQKEANNGLFAFYKADKAKDAYYIYSYKEKKWLTYAKATSYSNKTNFITLAAEKDTACYFRVHAYSGDNYEIQPYAKWAVSNKYLNWFMGIGNANPYDGNVTLGLWQQDGAQDKGSCWTFTRVVIANYTYLVKCAADETVSYNGKAYKNGERLTTEGTINTGDVRVAARPGQFATVVAHLTSPTEGTLTISYINTPSTTVSHTYETAMIYPARQDNVGEAKLTTTTENNNTIYTLSNKVLSAAFVKTSGALFFGGSKAMNLEGGTEPFSIAFGSGTTVSASAMTLKDVQEETLAANPSAVGGAEHYNGKALVAHYEYAYGDSVIAVEWRAVLRDGSHYLRTEMKLTGKNDLDMYNVIPLDYHVNAKEAGSVPAVVGNTRGAVVMNNKIFAGLENPVGYNTVGDATGDEDQWEADRSEAIVNLTAADWKQVSTADSVPPRIQEVSGYSYPNITAYNSKTYQFEKGRKVEVTVTYKTGSHKINLDGVELILNGSAAAGDFHYGYTGGNKLNNVYSMVVPETGNYTLRIYADTRESIDATSTLAVKTYKPKAGAIINTDIVSVRGRWSRNTTLKKGDTWKISGVVGLIAQDGKQNEADITKTQKRRSFLAYSERERAVPWRAFPAYISWYELNIDRNNAQNPTQNMNAEQVLDVERHWQADFYNRYQVGPKAFVIDDGWDNYGLWTFHEGFPNQMRDIARSAKNMNAGVGAWLGPVGGYGTSGDYRRNYWKNKGTMVLSNPKYYKVFLDAARNLTKNQGDFNFFKFDGISAQFSAVGPDAGDIGNENAEGIIRLEQFVRDSLRRDIFFNTTVGTWASPFWYHITDATWRQANDYGECANSNTIDRERWITYRDQLVYQNYVTNSPICPINTLMTHGFILSSHGAVSKNMDYNNVLRELRAAFVCGSGMVELYNDYALMNSINHGALWADLAECIKWQQRNADVLPDAHWVGGNPWNGTTTAIYGWAAWNGRKATLALRNGGNTPKDYTFTLRDALNIPGTVKAGTTITLRKSFGVQATLEGINEGEAIDIDRRLTVKLPASSLFCFDGTATPQSNVTSISIRGEGDSTHVAINKTLVLRATTNDEATFPALQWESANTDVAKVVNGLVIPVKEGEAVITAKATDGSHVSQSIKVTIGPKPFEPYACNFEKNATGTKHHRSIASITLEPKGRAAQTLSVGEAKPYIDKVDRVLTCVAGDTLTVNFAINGTWMNGYVYIDLDNNQVFDFKPNSPDQTGTDVMTYSFYTGSFSDDSKGQNSAGKQISGGARSTMDCPPFKAPEKPGTYRIRFKMDWNSIDPGGQVCDDGTLTSNNGFFANSGSIVDATLKVEKPADGIATINAEQDNGPIYDLQGRSLSKEPARGIFIRNGKKIVK